MLRLITKHSEYGEFRAPDLFLRSEFFYAAVVRTLDGPALGITISRRIGKAHVRNLLKRRIKAWARLRQDDFPPGWKFNLIARIGAGALDWKGLCLTLNTLLQQLPN